MVEKLAIDTCSSAPALAKARTVYPSEKSSPHWDIPNYKSYITKVATYPCPQLTEQT